MTHLESIDKREEGWEGAFRLNREGRLTCQLREIGQLVALVEEQKGRLLAVVKLAVGML